ncbi:MAG TPA: polysaccharide deacetylase family protein [Bryobacterales bacterium]|nr:polysaccharide deacetylase family protein [Bryobacterales bacterium]
MLSRRAILTYHSLDDSGSVISVRPELFARQMEALAAAGLRVVPLAELRSAPAPAVALTFDDGFQNFATVAAPVLARHGFPATVFLVTDYCGGWNDWPSQRAGIPRLPLLSWPQIADLSRAGIEFGAHTATHPDLAKLDEAAAREEILSSKRRVEDSAGRPAQSFAYPYGSMNEPARRLVAEHFTAGCSARLGWVTEASPPEALERLDVYYLSRLYLFRGLFGSPARWYLGLRAALREWK